MFSCNLSRMNKLFKAYKFSGVLNNIKLNKNFAVVANSITKDDRRDFMAVFPDVVRDLTNTGKYGDVTDIKIWLAKVLQHNVATRDEVYLASSGGKRLRGLTVVYSFKSMASSDLITDETIRLSQILGWCVEMFQGYQLVVDDIIDDAELRRGMPAWHKNPDVGLTAINDALLIESSIYELLKVHFNKKPYYTNMLELFHDIAFKTAIGQCLDAKLARNISNSGDLSKLTMDAYNSLVKYKTSYYTFHLPVALGMQLAGITDPELYRQAKSILLEIGRFFQVQDDYIDVFGNNEKTSSDIREGKCTWLSVVALQRCNTEQRKIMEDCYGSNDLNKIEEVKNLYLQLGLPSIFNAYEEESYKIIETTIQQTSRGMPHKLFFNLLENIYKRLR